MSDLPDPQSRPARRQRRNRRLRRTLRVFGTVLVACALATAALVQHASQRDARAAAATVVAGSPTPLWSPRRVPQLVAVAAVRQRFASVIATFSAPGRCVAIDAPSGQSLARVGASVPLAPASTEKLLTGAVALRVLGPAHRFVTALQSPAPIAGGVIDGDVYLVGGGDPVLATPAYRAQLAAQPVTAGQPTTALDDLATALAAKGVHRITGAVVADGSRYDLPRYLPSLSPSEHSDIGPLGALTVDDGIGPSGPAADPALLTANALATLLASRGITTGGGTRRGIAPGNAPRVAAIESPRLDAIVESMLTVSNNYTAEMLAPAIALARGAPGTSAAGLQWLTRSLAPLGIPSAGVNLVDGSGLSHDDRVTCAALLAAVGLGYRPGEHAILHGLPVAGRTGTLAMRFVGDPLAGRLRAKTGHIDGVVGLAGIVPTPVGDVRFAFLANGGFSVAEGEALQAQLAHLVARYPVLAQPRALVPAPAA